MAVPGRQPADEGEKRHRGKSTTADWQVVPDVPFNGEKPDLPKTRTILTRDGQEQIPLQAFTVQWWETVSSMPHCVLWSKADWLFALSTAIVADAAFCGIASAATELRNREKVLGTTVEFRRGLRIRYEEPKVATPVAVTNLDDYRDL